VILGYCLLHFILEQGLVSIKNPGISFVLIIRIRFMLMYLIYFMSVGFGLSL